MMFKACFRISLVALLLATAVAAQQKYSESTEYKPPKVDNKKLKGKPAASPAAPSPQGEATITIPVSVLDRTGSAIKDIRREEVTVFVDGVQVPISAFEQDKEPVTMVIVLDSSPSTALRFKTMQERASKLVDELPADMKVMIVDFNIRLNVQVEPTSDRAAIKKGISKVKMGDGTSIYSAVKFLYETLLPPITGRKVIALMTDGVDTTSKTSFAESIVAVEKEAVTVYPVYLDTFNDRRRSLGTTDWIAQILAQTRPLPGPTGSSKEEYQRGVEYLNHLSSATGGRTFSSEKLAEGTKSLIDELTNRYYVTLKLSNIDHAGHTIRVRVDRPALAVFARGSFRR